MPPRAQHPDGRSDRDRVRAYWDATHEAYLGDVGHTFQAGRFTGAASAEESNRWLAEAAELRAGQSVLDAGCGVCGPGVDIARHVAGLRIVGITVSARQAATARGLIREANLAGRVQVVHGDYHALPFRDETFHRVIFLESIGYAASLALLFRGVFRTLRTAGTLYVKDLFRREQLWSEQEARELAVFDDTFAQRTPAVSECIAAASDAGFERVRVRELSGLVTTMHAQRAMFEGPSRRSLSSFGRLHYRRYTCLPVYFAELTAERPQA